MPASHVLLIEPRGFGVNPETAASNAFQASTGSAGLEDKALVEHRRLVEALQQAGVGTTVLAPHRDDIPDAVFPNNWISTDPVGRIVLYPMESGIRQRELRPRIAEELRKAGFEVRETIDLSSEAAGAALEGTGSMVLDHVNRLAFAAISSRTSPELFRQWCRRFEFEPIDFHAADPDGKALYHTNVMMGLGSKLAVTCLECIPDADEREALRVTLAATGREILQIDWRQVTEFAGNVLFLQGSDGECMFISRRGWSSLAGEQRELVAAHAKPVPVAVDTIESTGGGSVRCMLAEIFLPRET